MTPAVRNGLADRYASILEAYLSEGDEALLENAYDLGRQAMSQGMGLVETVGVHQQALENVLFHRVAPGHRERLKKAINFFTDALSPFEMAYRGFEEANATLCSLNENLEERVRERTQALTQSEARYRELLELLPAAAYTCDAEGLITYYNRRAVELWGREPVRNDPIDRFCGSFRLSMPDGTRLRHDECWMAKVLREDKDYQGEEIVIEQPGGDKRTVLAHACPIHNERGNLIGAVNVLVDITDRKRAGEALRESEQRFARFMQHLPGLAWIEDLEGRYVFANDSAAKAFRVPEAELYGKSDDELFPPETATQFKENDRRALASPSGIQTVEILEHEDGVLHHSLVSKFPIHAGPDGRPALVGGMAIDITERIQAEEQLRRRERELADFFDNATIGLHWVGPDGVILRANRAELEMLGYTAEEYVGHHVADFYVDQDAIADILRRLHAGEDVLSREARLRCKDGSIRHVIVDSSVLWENGRFIHTRCFTRDVTEQKAAEEAVRQSHAVLNAVVEGTTDAVYVKDEQGRYLMINTAGARCMAKSVEEVVGKKDDEVFTPATGRQLILHDQQIMASGKTETFEETPTAGGTTRTYLSTKGPYYVGGRIRGVIGISRDITERQRAVETARFLAEATTVLAGSLDYETTLASVARLLVPGHADWCSIVLANDDGSTETVAVVHSDPEKVEFAKELQRRFAPRKDSPHGAAAAIRAGEPQLFASITPELLETNAQNAEHLRLLRGLGLRSALIVPLTARGRTFGALTLVTAETTRHYNSDDLPFAQELARRCAIAVDNARLYQAAQREIAERRRAEEQLECLNETLEQRVAEQTARVRLLHEVAIIANLAESFDEASRAVIERLCRFLDCSIGHLFTVTEGDEPKPVSTPVWYFEDPKRFARFRELTETMSGQSPLPFPGAVITAGQPRFLSDFDAGFRRIHDSRDLGLRNGFAFPVLVGRKVAAVLEFFSTGSIECSNELLDLMAHVGTQLGRVVERGEATEHLLKTNKLLATSQQLAHIGSWEWDVASNRVSWSDELYRIYGLEPQEFEASFEGFLEHVHPEDRQRVVATIGAALETRQAFRLDERIFRHGEIRTLRSQGEVVTDEAGNVLRLVGTCQDITEARQQEQALRVSELRFRSVWENSADGMRLTDADGIIVAVNEAYAKLVGNPADELEGKPLAVVYTEGRSEDTLAEYRDRFREGRVPKHFERRMPFRSGTLDVLVTTSRIELGNTPLLLSIFRDITDLKAAGERALRTERLAAIGEMITGLAHESRNALQRSQACLERLKWKVEGRPDELELVERIRQAQRDLHRTYEEVRQYAAPINLQGECHDVGKLLEETWDELAGVREGRSCRLLRFDAAGDLHAVVDPFAIKQVFRNILENALVACDATGDIDVRFTETKLDGAPGIAIAIGDNGPGLAEEARRRIFEPFYTTKSRGTGLGMAIAKRIVEAHRGQIDVGSRTCGTEIVLVLPRTR